MLGTCDPDSPVPHLLIPLPRNAGVQEILSFQPLHSTFVTLMPSSVDPPPQTPNERLEEAKVDENSIVSETPPLIHEKRPWLAYGLSVLPIIIVILSFAFYATLAVKKSIQAPRHFADLRHYSVRRYTQAFTYLGTILATAVLWGLHQAFKFTAQKQFLRGRRAYEVEVWSKLRTNKVFWVWSKDTRRQVAMVVTIITFVLGTSLPGGFASLLTPLPLEVGQPIVGETELDFLSNSTGCTKWHNNHLTTWLRSDCESWSDGESRTLRRCGNPMNLLDVLEGARASLLNRNATDVNQVLDSGGSSKSKDTSGRDISSFPRLAGMRVLDRTGGTAPVSYNSSGTNVYRHRGVGTYYKMTRQGLWTEASCQYADPSTFPVSFRNDTEGDLMVVVDCLDDSRSYNYTMGHPDSQLLFLEQCFNKTSLVWDIYARSFFSPHEIWLPFNNQNTAVHAGIGSMHCTLVAKVQDIHLIYNQGIGAAKVTPTSDTSSTGIQPVRIIEEVGQFAWDVLFHAQTGEIGNLLATVVDSLAVADYGLPGDQKDDRYPALLASALKGVYEYEASHYRFSQTLNATAPPECRRSVKGEIFPDAVGWEADTATLIGLMPLAIIATLLLYFTISSVLDEEPLPRFDPVNPISLIAASRVGDVDFSAREVGDPESEAVRNMKIKYGPVVANTPNAAMVGTGWGLVKARKSGADTEGVNQVTYSEKV